MSRAQKSSRPPLFDISLWLLCDCAWADWSRAAFFPAWSVKVRILYFSFYQGLKCCCSSRCAKPAVPPLLLSAFLSFSSVSLFLSLSVSICHSPNPASLRPFSNTSRVQANECHCRARKVITASSPLTPRGQIQPLVVHIKAITLP